MDRDLILIQKNVIARATERVKIKTISGAPGHTLRSQIRQASLLGLTYNLYRLRRPDLYEDVNRASLSPLFCGARRSVDSKGIYITPRLRKISFFFPSRHGPLVLEGWFVRDGGHSSNHRSN